MSHTEVPTNRPKDFLFRVLNGLDKKLWALRHKVEKRFPKLQSITIEITSGCNLTCTHCCMNATKIRDSQELSLSAISKFAEQVKRSFGSNVFIAITGGEPLMHSQIYAILANLKGQGFKLGLITNGISITEKTITNLDNTLSSVSVSIDGLKNSHDALRGRSSFEHAISAIKVLIEARIPQVMVNTGVNSGNMADLLNLSGELEALGVKRWHIYPVEPMGRGEQWSNNILSESQFLQLREIVATIRRRTHIKIVFNPHRSCWRQFDPPGPPCFAGISRMAVTHAGHIVPCLNCPDARESIEGRIESTDLKSLWESGFKGCRGTSCVK